MPTYEYECSACGHKFEEFQSITAKPITKCPKCGKKKVKRLISAGAGFIFKGSGFYETDYRSDAYKNAAKADAPKSETPPATKTDAAATPAATSTPTPTPTPTPAPAKSESKSKSKK